MNPHEGFGSESSRDEEEAMISELREIRPRPSEAFRRELDERVAAGFPPRRPGHSRRQSHPGNREPDATPPLRGLGERLGFSGRLRLGSALAGAAALCLIATIVVINNPIELGDRGDETMSQAVTGSDASESATEPVVPDDSAEMAIEPQLDRARDGGALQIDPVTGSPGAPLAADRRQRAVDRSATLALATEPADVPNVVAGVLGVVADHGGIVLSSTTRGGAEGDAGADFRLKIPSARLSQALTDLSELATLRDRRENTLDITAPTVSAADRLREARAEVRSLLKQLAEADTESERETVRIDLRPAQRRVAELRSRFAALERRAAYADVGVSILTGEAAALPTTEEWTVGEAIDDALTILTLLAGILIVAAAVLAPLSLLALLGWGLHRAWLRRSREQALRDERPANPAAAGDRRKDQPS